MEEHEPPPDAVAAAVQSVRRAGEGWAEADLPPLQSALALPHLTDEDTLRLIASLVREIAPRHVIELGCGPSTELLGLLGNEHGRMAVTTFEHDPWAAQELMTHASPFAINYRWFAFCLCPLVLRRCRGVPLPVYDDGMTTATVPYPADLAIVKGPPRELGGRGGTIFQLLKYARVGTSVLLLDVRPEEEAMLEAWVAELASSVLFVPPGLLGRHLAFVVREPVHEPFTLEKPLAQELAAITPEAESCVAALEHG